MTATDRWTSHPAGTLGDRVVITVGVVTPHAVAGADVELQDMAGDLVSTRVARIVSPPHGDSEPPTSVSGLRALTRPALLNGFRAARAVRALEERLGCLILESNLVLMWSVLAETGACVQIRDFGSLLHTLSWSAPTGAAAR